jgi:hypothetical protein
MMTKPLPFLPVMAGLDPATSGPRHEVPGSSPGMTVMMTAMTVVAAK